MGIAFALKKLAGFAARKVNYAERLGEQGLPKLKQIGKSKNGVKVYRGMDEHGAKYTVSFKKDGSPLKLVKQEKYKQNRGYMTTEGSQTLVRNYSKNEGLYIQKSKTDVKTDLSWLGRFFKPGDTVNYTSKSRYNSASFDKFVDGTSQWTQAGNPNWKWTLHERPGITKSVTENKYAPDWQNTQTYFELNNFKFPGGAVHNGRIGFDKGISPLDGEYLRRTRVNPFGDYIKIDYN